MKLNIERERLAVEALLDLVAKLGDAADDLSALCGKASAWSGTKRMNALRAGVITLRDEIVSELARAEQWRRSQPPRLPKPKAGGEVPGD